MKFYSGFSLKNEQYLFTNYLNDSQYCVAGFSYGAIKALNKVKDSLKKGLRVDTLTLLSPAFFQTKDTKFKKLQLMAYRKNKDIYLREFINSCFYPHQKKIIQEGDSTKEELEELLNYEWIADDFKAIKKQGVKIEVYLGGKDKIIDIQSAREFFLELSTLTYIKDANHFLQTR